MIDQGSGSQSLLARGRRSFQSLPSRIVFAVFAATLVTSLVVAWVSAQSIESFLRDKIDQKFPTLLRAANARLDLWYAQHELDAETLARSSILVGNAEHMAREGDGIGKDAVIAHHAVVGDVTVGHHQVVVADPGDATALHSPTSDRGELSERVVLTDLESRRLAVVLEILRIAPQRCMRVDLCARADDSGPGDCGV